MVPELMAQQGRDTARAIEGFGANIGNSLAGIADRLEKRKEEQKRTNQQAKAVDAFLGAMTDEQRSGLGIRDMNEFKNRSAADKRDFALGLKMRQEYDAARLMRDRFDFDQKQAAEERKRQDEADRALGEALRRGQQSMPPANLPPLLPPPAPSPFADPSRFQLRLNPQRPAPSLPPPSFSQQQPTFPPPTASASLSPEEFMRRVAENPAALRSPAAADLLREMLRAKAGGEGVNSLFRADELGVARPTSVQDTYFMPTSRGGGQVVIDPRAPMRPAGDKVSDEGYIEMPDPSDPMFGPRIRIPIKVAREKYPHLLKQLDGPSATPAGGERVVVEKDGKKFTLPKAQLTEAQKQGYKLIK